MNFGLKLYNLSKTYKIVYSFTKVHCKNYNSQCFRGAKAISQRHTPTVIAAAVLTVWFGYKLGKTKIHLLNETPKQVQAGEVDTKLPFFTQKDVSKHNDQNTSIWITYKNGVYDVTSFVSQHPGNKTNILLGAGTSIDPFWELYSFHKTPQTLELLETMRIGNLDEYIDDKDTSKDSDPYAYDPKRHPILKPASVCPFNAEPPSALLVESFITPTELFYVRNHLPVPSIDLKDYRLEIEVGDKVHSFTLDDLRKMPECTITATIMCAGNRRSEMSDVKSVKGLSWNAAAIGNATWTGVRLEHVLRSLGVDDTSERDFNHVQLWGMDADVTNSCYGGSIPFWRAVDRKCDVLLAYEMNGQPLTSDHGYPLRVIVPGVVGARNVKWLNSIRLSKDESPAHWQQNDYKGFSPSVDWSNVDFSKAPAIQELPVISAICSPENQTTVTVKDGFLIAKGYAWSGNGQRIVRVDVTADKGATWHVAELEQLPIDSPRHWAWTLWSLRIPIDTKSKSVEIWAKAVDSSYNTQPETFQNIWNLRGVLSNAYHRITVNVKQ